LPTTKQCPACWSTIEVTEAVCPHCQETLIRPRRIWRLAFAGAVLAIAAWWGVGQALRPTNQARAGNQEATRKAPDAPPAQRAGSTPTQEEPDPTNADNNNPAQPATAPAASPFLPVFDGDGELLGSLLALAPAARGRQHYCVAAELLPTGSGLHTQAAELLDFEVIRWDRVGGLVLLVGPAIDARSEAVAALRVGAPRTPQASDLLTAISPAGRRWSGIHIKPRSNPMVVSQATPPGSVLVDAGGHAIALMGKRHFHPLDPLVPLQRSWRGAPLELTQKQIRATDPQKVVEDVRRLVDNKNATLEGVATAIQLLQQSQHLASSREAIEAFDTLMRWAHHQRIRLLTRADGAKALQQAVESYRQFPDHLGIHSDVALLLLEYGDPFEAILVFQALRSASARHGEEIAGKVTAQVAAKLRGMLRAGRAREAVALGARAVQALPLRADLRITYAQTLLKAGNHSLARSEALEALRLDPTKQSFFDRMNFKNPNRSTRTTSRTVVIPFDPSQKQIRTRGSVGSQDIQLIVDTGASYTTVPRQVAQNLGLLGKAVKARVQTANGPVDTLRVVLPSLTIDGQIHLENVPAVILDLDGSLHNSGLLGLDVLQKLNMRIDSEKSRLILRQSHNRRGR